MPFLFSPAQEKLDKEFVKGGTLYILKPRQAWVTAIVLARIFVYLILNPGTIAYTAAHSEKIVLEFRQRLDLFIRSLGIPTKKEREDVVVFWNDSRWHFETIGGKEVALGTTVHIAHLTEIHAWENAEKNFQHILGSVAKGGLVILESTPGRYGEFWHKEYKRGKETSSIKAAFLPWWLVKEYQLERNHGLDGVPAYESIMSPPPTEDEVYLVKYHGLNENQIAWRRWQISLRGSLDEFRGQYPEDDISCWLQTSGGYFNNAKIAEKVRLGLVPPGVVEDSGRVKVWHLPEPGHWYSLGVDVGGTMEHSDPTAMVMFDCSTGWCAMTYHGKPTTLECSVIAAAWSEYYNKALIFIERPGPGDVVSDMLAFRTDPTINLNLFFWDEQQPGFYSVAKGPMSKSMVLGSFKRDWEIDNLEIWEPILYEESPSFQVSDNPLKVGAAARGAHDDMIRAAALAWHGRLYASGPTGTQYLRDLVPRTPKLGESYGAY